MTDASENNDTPKTEAEELDKIQLEEIGNLEELGIELEEEEEDEEEDIVPQDDAVVDGGPSGEGNADAGSDSGDSLPSNEDELLAIARKNVTQQMKHGYDEMDSDDTDEEEEEIGIPTKDGAAKDEDSLDEEDIVVPTRDMLAKSGEDELQIAEQLQKIQDKEKKNQQAVYAAKELQHISVDISKCILIGHIAAVLPDSITVLSKYGGNLYDEGTVLCLKDCTILGKISDIFGPVVHPSYHVLYPEDTTPPQAAEVDMDVYAVPTDMSVLYDKNEEPLPVHKALEKRGLHPEGTDASWTKDDEPPDWALDYSDDEKEKSAKRDLKLHKLQTKLQKMEDSERKTYLERAQARKTPRESEPGLPPSKRQRSEVVHPPPPKGAARGRGGRGGRGHATPLPPYRAPTMGHHLHHHHQHAARVAPPPHPLSHQSHHPHHLPPPPSPHHAPIARQHYAPPQQQQHLSQQHSIAQQQAVAAQQQQPMHTPRGTPPPQHHMQVPGSVRGPPLPPQAHPANPPPHFHHPHHPHHHHAHSNLPPPSMGHSPHQHHHHHHPHQHRHQTAPPPFPKHSGQPPPIAHQQQPPTRGQPPSLHAVLSSGPQPIATHPPPYKQRNNPPPHPNLTPATRPPPPPPMGVALMGPTTTTHQHHQLIPTIKVYKGTAGTPTSATPQPPPYKQPVTPTSNVHPEPPAYYHPNNAHQAPPPPTIHTNGPTSTGTQPPPYKHPPRTGATTSHTLPPPINNRTGIKPPPLSLPTQLTPGLTTKESAGQFVVDPSKIHFPDPPTTTYGRGPLPYQYQPMASQIALNKFSLVAEYDDGY